MFSRNFFFFTLVIFGFVFAGCTKPASKTADTATTAKTNATSTETDATTDVATDTDTEVNLGTVAIDSVLAEGFPYGMAAPLGDNSADANLLLGTVAIENPSLRLKNKPKFKLGEEPPKVDEGGGTPGNYAATLQEQIELLNGTADICVDRITTDRMAFGILGGCASLTGVTVYNQEGDNVCAPSMANTNKSFTDNFIKFATKTTLALFCLAKKNSIVTEKLSANSTPIDLTSAVQEEFGNLKTSLSSSDPGGEFFTPTFSYAKIARLADQSSRPVYRTDLRFDLDPIHEPFQDENKIKTKEVHLVHSPFADDPYSYDGVFWIRGEPPADQPNKEAWWSIRYQRRSIDGDYFLKFEFTSILSNPQYIPDPILSSGILDFNSGASFNSGDIGDINNYGKFPGAPNHNDALIKQRMFGLKVDLLTGAGDMTSWQNTDGNYYKQAFGYYISLSGNDSEEYPLIGTGFFGYSFLPQNIDGQNTVSIRRWEKEKDSNADIGLFPMKIHFGYCNGDQNVDTIIDINGNINCTSGGPSFTYSDKGWKQSFKCGILNGSLANCILNNAPANPENWRSYLTTWTPGGDNGVNVIDFDDIVPFADSVKP